MNSAVLTVGDIVKKIGKLKYEFPTPKLDKFAHALTLAVDAAKDAAKKISNVEATFHVKKEVTTVK
jgi:hypothetical protein